MKERWWHRGFTYLSLFATGVLFSSPAMADTAIVPELSIFKTHNTIFRSRFATNITYNHALDDFTTAGFEYDLDVGVGSFFRRYIFKDPNAEKSKFVTFRLGYAYIPDLTTGDPAAIEHRGITAFTLRLPIGNSWLLSDRNQVDLRHFTYTDFIRYRNRLRVERNVNLGGFRTTPYINGEVYLDSLKDEWNQADATAGAEFPWRYSMIMEVYYTWIFQRHDENNQIVGITFQKHL